MARSSRNLNPEGSGKGSLSLGQSGQGARAVANQRAGAGAAARAAQARAVAQTAGREAGRRLAIINNPKLTVTGAGGRQGALDRMFEQWYKPAKDVGQITKAVWKSVFPKGR